MYQPKKDDKEMRIISVLNQKGGIGKTTTAYNIAAELAQRGYKVLMIDNDGQSSLTLACGVDPIKTPHSMIEVYLDNLPIEKNIVRTKVDRLFLAPSNLRLSSRESLIRDKLQRESILKNALSRIKDRADFCVIDNPPHLGIVTFNSLIASDYVIIPCEASPLSTFALEDTKTTIDGMKEINDKLKLLGVVVTKYFDQANVQKEQLSFIKDNFDVLGLVKRSTEAEKPVTEGLPCVVYNPKTDVAKSYKEITDKLLEEINENNGQ